MAVCSVNFERQTALELRERTYRRAVGYNTVFEVLKRGCARIPEARASTEIAAAGPDELGKLAELSHIALPIGDNWTLNVLRQRKEGGQGH